MDRITCIVLLLIAVGCVTTGRSSLAKLPQEKGSKTPAVQVDMRNVMYHFPFIGDKLVIGKFCALARGI